MYIVTKALLLTEIDILGNSLKYVYVFLVIGDAFVWIYFIITVALVTSSFSCGEAKSKKCLELNIQYRSFRFDLKKCKYEKATTVTRIYNKYNINT